VPSVPGAGIGGGAGRLVREGSGTTVPPVPVGAGRVVLDGGRTVVGSGRVEVVDHLRGQCPTGERVAADDLHDHQRGL
jgi:hypothetical protein